MWNLLLRLQPKLLKSVFNSNKHYLFLTQLRNFGKEAPKSAQSIRIRSTIYYAAGATILTVGLSYAAVPLYRMFCSSFSYGGTTGVQHDGSKVEAMEIVPDRIIRIKFNADLGASMRWNFKPQQQEIRVAPGETALAFYKAKNPTDLPVIGVSTYNVIPFEAGAYFNKIQCFCFEEQQLNPHEEVSSTYFTIFLKKHLSLPRWTCRCFFTSILIL